MKALMFAGFCVTGLLAVTKAIGVVVVFLNETRDDYFILKQSVYAIAFAVAAGACWRSWRRRPQNSDPSTS